MIIRAVVNQYDYLVKHERIIKHELRLIYANPDTNGIWENPEDLLEILTREHHVNCIVVDETAFNKRDFIPFLLKLRKKTGDQVRLIPITTNKEIIPDLVSKQLNQFFELDIEQSEEEQCFLLDGLLTNPRTASDVEALMQQLISSPEEKIKVETQTKIVESVRIEKELFKQKRIAFINLFAGAGATTISLESFEFLQKNRVKTQLISFDSKIEERYSESEQVITRNEFNFLKELELIESDNEVLLYDFSACEFEDIREYEKYFTDIYYVFDYNYPQIWRNPTVFTEVMNHRGKFLLNKHGTLPAIDRHFKEILAIPEEKQIYTFPNIDRDEIVFAEINRTVTHNQKVEETLQNLFDIKTKSKTKGFKNLLAKFKK